MNDEQMQPLLEVWLRDRDEAPRDVNGGIARVVARVPQTRQRGRWWPFPVLYRRAKTSTTSDTAEYQSSPIPATNGHAPTVIGRTQTMFSPVKAITTAALVLGLSAAFLVAQPFDRLGGGVPGAEQGADPAAPVMVEVTTLGDPIVSCYEDPAIEVDGPVTWEWGTTCEVQQKWSDPRLKGTETYVENLVEYNDDSELWVAHYVHNIVTDDGAWRMRPQFRFESAGMDSPVGPGSFSGTWVLDGEGAYEGLIAVLAKDEHGGLSGFIISHDLPPAPEGASTK